MANMATRKSCLTTWQHFISIFAIPLIGLPFDQWGTPDGPDARPCHSFPPNESSSQHPKESMDGWMVLFRIRNSSDLFWWDATHSTPGCFFWWSFLPNLGCVGCHSWFFAMAAAKNFCIWQSRPFPRQSPLMPKNARQMEATIDLTTSRCCQVLGWFLNLSDPKSVDIMMIFCIGICVQLLSICAYLHVPLYMYVWSRPLHGPHDRSLLCYV